jgi:L-rhamnose isomerase
MSDSEGSGPGVSWAGASRQARDAERILRLQRRIAELETEVAAKEIVIAQQEVFFDERVAREVEKYKDSEDFFSAVRQWGLEYASTAARFCKALICLNLGHRAARNIDVDKVVADVDKEVTFNVFQDAGGDYFPVTPLYMPATPTSDG